MEVGYLYYAVAVKGGRQFMAADTHLSYLQEVAAYDIAVQQEQ